MSPLFIHLCTGLWLAVGWHYPLRPFSVRLLIYVEWGCDSCNKLPSNWWETTDPSPSSCLSLHFQGHSRGPSSGHPHQHWWGSVLLGLLPQPSWGITDLYSPVTNTAESFPYLMAIWTSWEKGLVKCFRTRLGFIELLSGYCSWGNNLETNKIVH